MSDQSAHPEAATKSLTRSDVAKVALLARLALSNDEIDSMTAELGQIIKYVEQLGELDTESVEPLAHAADIHNVFREDAFSPGLDREAALGNAPSRDEECFRVPAVLGE